jgi:SAM-dependent methyltransferase
MYAIVQWLEKTLLQYTRVAFEVLDPDVAPGHYAGESVSHNQRTYLYRGYKAWNDLAEQCGCRMCTPVAVESGIVRLTFEKLKTTDSFHCGEVGDKAEKYGVDSAFFAIHKNEEPAFMIAFADALKRSGIEKRKRILNLGVNRGDEFELIRQMDPEGFATCDLVGIDHSATAIDYASSRFDASHTRFYRHDINVLDELELGRFDLIITIGTLQSPGIAFKPLFMKLVQEYLEADGAMILGFPNCRWMDGEMLYGAKAPNYSFPEQSLLHNDVDFCKRYLQQKKFRVTLTGKPYRFLTATPIRRKQTATLDA